MLKDRRHGCPKAIRMTSDWRAPLSFTTMPLKSWPACCAVSDRTWLAPRCWETACCTRSRSILRRTDGCAKPISWTIQTRLERLSFPPVSPSSSRAALREIWHGREWRSRNWRIARELKPIWTALSGWAIGFSPTHLIREAQAATTLPSEPTR